MASRSDADLFPKKRPFLQYSEEMLSVLLFHQSTLNGVTCRHFDLSNFHLKLLFNQYRSVLQEYFIFNDFCDFFKEPVSEGIIFPLVQSDAPLLF